MFAGKANVRLLEVPLARTTNALDFKRVGGGVLLQSADANNVSASTLRVVTKRAPSASQLDDLLFAWKVAKFVKSNAIVFCTDGMTWASARGR